MSICLASFLDAQRSRSAVVSRSPRISNESLERTINSDFGRFSFSRAAMHSSLFILKLYHEEKAGRKAPRWLFVK